MIQLTLTLKMTTSQVVETSVTVSNNSPPIQDYVHPDDQTQPTIDTTLCQIATDLTTTFYQIPLAPKLVKYCSVGPVEYPFSDGYARLRNCIGRAHVSCTWRSYSMKELLPRLATHQYCGAWSYCTTWNECFRPSPSATSNSLHSKTFINPKSTMIFGWNPPSLPSSALTLCSKPETVGPFKGLHWCIQSASWHYTPVLSLASTTWHCHHRSSVSWEDQLVWWSTLSQCPVSPSAPSPSPALIINCGSPKMELSKLQVSPPQCIWYVTIRYS